MNNENNVERLDLLYRKFYEIKMGLSSPKFVVKEKKLVKVNNSKHC